MLPPLVTRGDAHLRSVTSIQGLTSLGERTCLWFEASAHEASNKTMMKPASYHSFLLDHFFFLPLRTRPGDSSCIPATKDVNCNYPRGNPYKV